jgi:peptidylprolyl isomerase
MLGAGRDNPADSGGGTELYVVIGHAPRHLDRNVTLLGRVLQGMERTPIRALRVAADVPAGERSPLEVLRTDTSTFEKLVESRRNRREEWFQAAAGHIELCNVPLPVRPAP